MRLLVSVTNGKLKVSLALRATVLKGPVSFLLVLSWGPVTRLVNLTEENLKFKFSSAGAGEFPR